MGLEFLARVRRATAVLGLLAGLFAAVYRTPAEGLALALGVAWSLANLLALEKLVVVLTGENRRTAASARRAALVLAGMLALFGLGAWLLSRLSPPALVTGFLAPYAVMVFKAASALLLETAAWRRLTRDPWRAAAFVVALTLVSWLAVSWLAANGRAGAGAAAGAAPHAGVAAPGGDHAGAAEGTSPHAAAAAHAEAGGGEETGPKKFPNVITILARAFPDAPWARFLHHYEVIFFSLLVAVLLSVIARIATRRPQLVPGPLQNAVEAVVEQLYDFIVGILGPKYGPRYVPYLGTVFIYILAMNLFGLVPLMDSPTSSLNVTLALAIVTFLYVQYTGIRELSPLGYIDHMMGSPRSVVSWVLVPVMLPVHLIGELAKPVSLSCRLFGNLFGEDMLLAAFAALGVSSLAFAHLPIGLPLQLPFMVLALLFSTIQALVFTVLSTIYFLLMLPHDEHGAEGEASPAH